MGTMLLGMGQGEIGMTLVMILAAGLSVWLTDIKGWVYLNRNLANLIMLGAALFSLRGLTHLYSEFQALSFAQLLIYLQIILLFQKKDSRTYWLLIMLSMLQVVVAALFSQGVFFGMLLVAYMLFASLSLTLLLLNRQCELLSPRGERRSSAEKTSSSEKSASRWPLIDLPPNFDAPESDGGRQGIVGELFRRLFGMAVRTLGLTMVLFVITPRFGQVGWGGGGYAMQPKATVGFNDQVTLGELGKLIESPSEVMQIRFFEKDNETPYLTDGEIYLYGGLLTDYAHGRWKVGAATNFRPPSVGKPHLERLPGDILPKSYIVQKCKIENLDRNELFFVDPGFIIELDNTAINPNHSTCRLFRENDFRTKKFSYRLGTTAFLEGVQSKLTPLYWKKEDEKLAMNVPRDKKGEPELKKLKELADRWIAESKLPPSDVLGRAQFLEHKLSDSGQYQYSLVGQKRNPNLDPIEDFLIEHKAGHCEYFATALTLMLRHEGIPARMVIGFHCTEWHESEQCYQVRQLHAHTWVQAYLKPDQLPKHSLHGEEYWDWKEKGGWYRLDPTPASNRAANDGFFAPIDNALQWLNFTWSYYVVELNSERQRKAIFAPIADAAIDLKNFLFSRETWDAFYERITDALQSSGAVGALAWTLLIVTVAAAIALAGLNGYLFWRLGRSVWLIIEARRSKRRRGPRIEVEFYRRFEHLLAKNGLSRPLGQTPQEFAGPAGEWLALWTGENRLLPLPAKVVDAYYRVRYGQLPLEDGQSQEIDWILKEVEIRIANRKRRNGKK
jgi:hypothetical protein